MNVSRILALGGSICCVLHGSEALGGSICCVLRGLRLSGGSVSNEPFRDGGSAKERLSRGWGGGGGGGGRGSICRVLRGSEALGSSFVSVLRVGEALGGSDV